MSVHSKILPHSSDRTYVRGMYWILLSPKIAGNKYGSSAKMWSPGGYDFSSSITDFVTLIISHAIFFCKLCYSEIAFGMSWAEGGSFFNRF